MAQPFQGTETMPAPEAPSRDWAQQEGRYVRQEKSIPPLAAVETPAEPQAETI